MGRTFKPTDKRLGVLLGVNEPLLVIVPPHQRSYSWESPQVTALWEDLAGFRERAASAAEVYFFGPIVVQDDRASVTLLDGQQRLATCTILAATIRDCAKQVGGADGAVLARDIQKEFIRSKAGKPALTLGELDNPYFEKVIQAESPIRIDPELRSHKRIQTAQGIFKERLEALLKDKTGKKSVEELRRIYSILAQQVVVVEIKVESEDDAYWIFETLNDRGLRLSNPDLILNHLMRVAGDADARTQIRLTWDAMLESLGSVDIDRYFRHLWLSKYGDLKQKSLFQEIKERIKGGAYSALDFAKACQEECQDYTQVVEPEKADWGDMFETIVALVKKLGVGSAIPFLLASKRCLSRKYLKSAVQLALRLAVRHGALCNLNPGDLESCFFSTSLAVRKGKADGRTEKQLVDEIRQRFAKIDPEDAKLSALIPTSELSRSQAAYLLRAIAEEIQTKTGEAGLAKVNLEHVFPQNPDGDWTPDEVKDLRDLTWTLGNLTILGEEFNRKASNKKYSTKRVDYYSKSEVEMTKQLVASYVGPKWGKKEILARAATLGASAIKLWARIGPR